MQSASRCAVRLSTSTLSIPSNGFDDAVAQFAIELLVVRIRVRREVD